MAIQPVESFARVGGLHFVYAEAAEKSYFDYVRLSHQIEAYGCIEYDENLQNLKYDKTIAGLQTVVFSAMCFEAAIYDFASIYLGDDYVRDHLDKLDVLFKWLVVMRFVSGIEIPKAEAPYGALKNLVAERNRLVTRSLNRWTWIIVNVKLPECLSVRVSLKMARTTRSEPLF